ncbi:transposase domain-containing protein [Novosphingobium clariflavum]|uniref:Transposase domain-containing protein n=1 Tax=Novosphingobium clariflavum TaxID=2029884 RepID=A0ABV6SB33_9SPHN|nr:transposase domain-containing protein [Novosphingobium clariflavum]
MASRALDEFQETAREWFTPAELADLALPGLPADKRSINRRAQEERWSMRTNAAGELLVRPRAGRGGGVEFHVSLLPGTARLELSRRGLTDARPAPEKVETDNGGWRWFDVQSAKVKTEAERRLGIINEIELLEGSGLTRSAAVSESGRRHSVGVSTMWNWLDKITGVAKENRLPALAPRRKGGGAVADIDPLLWNLFKSDYLRPSAPTLTSCYNRTAEIAKARGLSMPSEKTFKRRLEKETPKAVIKLRREGEEALRRSIPSQRRTVSDLHALECINIDGHKFDVFVKTPDGRVIRPIMVAIQDVYSRKFLSWRIGGEESAIQARLAFADVFEVFGIPKECVLDNGRAWASKWITGGAKSRFRFKIKEEEPTGLLTALGIGIHWALPYRGQSKPIERGFRDLCETIAKHPAMEGAYTGNNPMAKPENYGSKAIEWNAFVAHVDRGMAAHNAKQGRRTEMARNRSFDEVFAESYASAPIGKATPEQMRMALLAAEQKSVDRRTGEIELYGNRYWSEACGELHGQKVTVRFDPDNLMREVHLYALDGRYLTSAEIIQDTGFLDAASAKTAAKRWADYRKRIRGAAEAEMLLAAEQVAALQADTAKMELPEPAVIRPVRHRGQTAAALKPAPLAVQHHEREARVFNALKLVGGTDD